MKIEQGGLMRCCVKTAEYFIQEYRDRVPSGYFYCMWCGDRMVREGDVIKWAPKMRSGVIGSTPGFEPGS